MNNSRNPPQPPNARQLNQQVNSFNTRYPVGSSVTYCHRGKLIGTKTKSAAWIMGGHSVMVMLEGVTGAYSIDHLKPGNPSAHNLAPAAKDETAPAKPGACRHCGCTHETPCVLRGGIMCSWMDDEQTICSNPRCVATAAYQLAWRYATRHPNAPAITRADVEQHQAEAARLGVKLILKTSGTGATTV